MRKKDRRARNKKKKLALFSGISERVRRIFTAKHRSGDLAQLEFKFSGEQVVIDKKDPVSSFGKQLNLLSDIPGSNFKSKS